MYFWIWLIAINRLTEIEQFNQIHQSEYYAWTHTSSCDSVSLWFVPVVHVYNTRFSSAVWPPDPLHLSNKRSLSLKISSMDEYPVIVTFSKLYDFLPSAEQKRRDLENIGNLLFWKLFSFPPSSNVWKKHCSTVLDKSLWWWRNKDRIFIFGLSIPLKRNQNYSPSNEAIKQLLHLLSQSEQWKGPLTNQKHDNELIPIKSPVVQTVSWLATDTDLSLAWVATDVDILRQWSEQQWWKRDEWGWKPFCHSKKLIQLPVCQSKSHQCMHLLPVSVL